MRIGILTSIDIRHRYFVNALRDHFEIAAVGYEETGYSPAAVDYDGLSRDEVKVVLAHFAERTRQEMLFFGERAHFLSEAEGISVSRIAPGTLNSEDTLSFLAEYDVDTLVVYGTNLIKEPLLTTWSGRIINMHLGLSPYYRGTATNFYPLLNGEPEYIGATIHLIDSGIDSGPILKHARPVIEKHDEPHIIGCKAIQAGIDAMVDVLQKFDQHRISPVIQWKTPGAKLYLRKDYHPRQVVAMYEKLKEGIIPRFVEQTAERAWREPRLVD
ncbi:MAG: formyl transferase [Planctomycetota bacterium]|jgi:folate-dependent phosphoribosylglycinamide formyltransferase PurN